MRRRTGSGQGPHAERLAASHTRFHSRVPGLSRDWFASFETPPRPSGRPTFPASLRPPFAVVRSLARSDLKDLSVQRSAVGHSRVSRATLSPREGSASPWVPLSRILSRSITLSRSGTPDHLTSFDLRPRRRSCHRSLLISPSLPPFVPKRLGPSRAVRWRSPGFTELASQILRCAGGSQTRKPCSAEA